MPLRNQKYETQPLGRVPDFDRLHRDLDLEMTRTRSNMRRQLTVPHEFKLNGANPQEQQEREHKVGGAGMGGSSRLPGMRWDFLDVEGYFKA